MNIPPLVPDEITWSKPGNLAQNTVLTTIQATHADLALSRGVLTCTGGISVKVASITDWEVISYAAGQVQVTAVDLSSITVSDNTVYKITIMTLSDNQVYTLEVISGIGATAASIAAQFALAVTNNSNLVVSAIAQGNVVIFTELTTATAGFQIVGPLGSVIANATYLTMGAITGTFQVGETVTQATSAASGKIAAIVLLPTPIITVYAVSGTFDTSHVVTGGTSSATSTPSAVTAATDIQPSGIPAEVSVYAGAPVTGTYTLYAITYNQDSPNSGISGLLKTSALAYIWANTGSSNFSAFDTYLQNILDGSHTPVADYLGGV
jgi:hypothetical protein